MAEFATRSSLDLNSLYGNPHSHLAAMSHYSSPHGMNYVYSSGPIQYDTVPSTYSTVPPSFVTHADTNSDLYLPASSLSSDYARTAAKVPTIPSQHRPNLALSLFSPNATPVRQPELPSRSSRWQEAFTLPETESQESPNAHSMLSEAVVPAAEGYPNVQEFDELMACYVRGLSPKKRDKALIHAQRATNIRTVLLDKKTTAVESAQFRFWVKKMFTLLPNDPKVADRRRKICHEGKPVAIREKLFKILTRAHKQCQHGGRDKTSAQVRKIYSWVPKELISRFVKLCPTCQNRRGTRASPVTSSRSEPDYMEVSPQSSNSSHDSRRESFATNRNSFSMHSPVSALAGFSPAFQSQNRWMTPVQQFPRHDNAASTTTYNTVPDRLPQKRHMTSDSSYFNHDFSSQPQFAAPRPSYSSVRCYQSGSGHSIGSSPTINIHAIYRGPSIKAE